MIHQHIKAIQNHAIGYQRVWGYQSGGVLCGSRREYFFERPDLLKNKHTELLRMLDTIFQKSVHTSPQQ